MEFVFGTLATDALKMLHHRVARQGLRHAHEMSPRDPLPGQPVTIFVTTGVDQTLNHVACYYTTDGSLPHGTRGMARNGQIVRLEPVDVIWDTLAWGYMTRWQGTIPAQEDGAVVRYQISGWADDGPEIYADWPDMKATTEAAAGAFFRDEPFDYSQYVSSVQPNIFTYYVDRLRAPQWARDSIIYHVFVDRFYPGDGHHWLKPRNISGFFGGTLWGVRDKLDYIADLGATCIWLSPTFPSSTHHGYDITDYHHVEARLGGDEALRALIEAAHARGIRVLLDLVCNHMSDRHPIFQAALKDKTSPYQEWFIFDDSKIGYRTFFDVPSMPYINLANPEARAWMLDVARYWLEVFDVDGYRLDHANGPGPDFWVDFRAVCRSVKPDSFCFGEVVEAPDVLRAYVGKLDGLLDFHLEDALRQTYATKTWTEDQFQRFVAGHYQYFPPDFVMPTFLDNHDMDRFLFVAGNDKDALKQAAAVQMRLPGPPIIYYGTEVGMTQKHGKADGFGLEESRLPMLWGDAQDGDLLTYYRQLIQDRKMRTTT